MLTTVFNIAAKIGIQLSYLLIFRLKSRYLFVTLIHLIYPQFMSIFSLTEYLSQFVISHNFSLTSSLIVYGLTFKFISQRTHLRNIRLQSTNIILCIRHLNIEIGNIIINSIDIPIQLIIIILIGQYLSLYDVLLTPQLTLISLQLLYLPAYSIIANFILP